MSLPASEHILVPYFAIHQLHSQKTPEDCFINIRAVHNKIPHPDPKTGRTVEDTISVFNKNIRIDEFRSHWYDQGLYYELVKLNLSATQPANIYFGVNPRKQSLGNKKEHVLGFASFFLDMDGHKSYTKSQRWAQIQFWIDYGIPPTFVIDSGNGYHVYWVLNNFCSAEDGERILKHMIALSGCKAGGNCSDVTRVLRLPGFYNVKTWWMHQEKNEAPPSCNVVYPANFLDVIKNKIILPRYNWEEFIQFPPSELGHLAEYQKRALAIHPYQDIHGTEIVRNIMKEHGRLAHENSAQLEAQKLFSEQEKTVQKPIAGKEIEWEPTLKFTPELEDIKWSSGKSWLKKYCKKGFAGLTQEDLENIAKKLNVKHDELSASELDAKVMYELIRQGYTRDGVRDFWTRSSLNLYRPEKEKKSPNYFDETYNKMLIMVKSSMAASSINNVIASNIINQVVIDARQTFVRKPDGTLELVLNAEFVLKHIYKDEDTADPGKSEWYEIDAIVPAHFTDKGFENYNLFLPREAFNEMSKFKQLMHDRLTIVTNNCAHLQRLLHYLLTTFHDVPIKKLRTKMTYTKGSFIFPQFTIHKDSITEGNIIKDSKYLQMQFKTWDWMTDKIAPIDTIKEMIQKHWTGLLNIHLPNVVGSILGVTVAAAIRPRFELEENILDFHIPTVNVRGAGHSGKSETVPLLTSITGIISGRNRLSIASTNFALTKMLDMMTTIPIIIDEFKEEGNINEKQISIVRDVVRRNYSGEIMLKGKADLSLDTTKVHGTIIVMGESPLERIGNVAEISRIIPILTNSFNPNAYVSTFNNIKDVQWYLLGPHFFKFILNLDLTEEYNAFKEIKIRIIEKIKNIFDAGKLRIAHNISVIVFGCYIMDKFINSIDNSSASIVKTLNVENSLLKELKDWAIDENQAVTIEEERPEINSQGEAITTKIITTITINECLQFIKEISDMIELKPQSIIDMQTSSKPIYKIGLKADKLYLNFHGLYDAYITHCLARRMPYYSKSSLRLQFKSAIKNSAPWIHELDAVAALEDGKSHRCLVLKYSVITKMNLWRLQDEEKTNAVPKNRISEFLTGGSEIT